MMDKSGVVSYVVGSATVIGAATVEQWSTMDWLSALGIIVGVIGVLVRIYTDIAAHLGRRKE
ncbi:hypothetical protein H0A36_23445 [Endozoicomonas sp. SM1973]|uniref:Holin n=1 Tax=Spartinivicinus marinus TaxID=2994442 RepID=A0A853I826_9GAMM|nr:hypothetical protein [Spartinivicinus marinus]MCX4025067.1 hypothetical protein [Spartinivicinus marinus]NYZ68979.1 hypothetical protein [Spartinivicinus marinus]